MNTNPTVVLVHGAFAESASWNAVIGQLDDHGIHSIAPPTSSAASPAMLPSSPACSPPSTAPSCSSATPTEER